MAKSQSRVQLDNFFNRIGVEFDNMSCEQADAFNILGDSLKDSAFGVLYTTEVETGLIKILQLFGGKYDDLSLNYWRADGKYVVVGPCIYHSGLGPVLEWGKQVIKLEGSLEGVPRGSKESSGPTLKVKSTDGKYRMSVRIMLDHDGSDNDRKRVNEAWEDCESWEEAAELLKHRLQVVDRETLFSKDRTLEVLSVEAKEKDGRMFYMVGVKEKELGAFLAFLPDEANPKVGMIIETIGNESCYVVRGEKFYSAQYHKLKEFEPGTVLEVTKVEDNTGEYGGRTLHTDKGLVTANTQFNRWYEAQDCPEVDTGKPLLVTILKVEKRGKGEDARAIVTIHIRSKNEDTRFGLASLLGVKPPTAEEKTEAMEEFMDEVVSDDVDEEDEDEVEAPEPQGLGSLVPKPETLTPPPAVKANKELVESGAGSDWL